jgi:hypothetical protein
MKTYWMTITPAIAEEWLKTNGRNRPVKEAHVRYLAREMEAGRWQENGETVKRNGTTLLDGQHRLLACVKAKTPFRTLVVEGLDDSIFRSVDGGIGRSGADTLAVMGEKNTKRLAAALVIVENYMTGAMETGRKKFSNAEVEELLEKYPKLRDSVNRSDINTRLVPPSVMAACHFLFAQKDEVLAELFVQQVLKGNDLKEGEPTYVLRERLVRNSLEKAKLTPPYIAALLIKAWNHTRAGNRIKHLRYRERGDARETFPLVA